jgi:hypothetical protein
MVVYSKSDVWIMWEQPWSKVTINGEDEGTLIWRPNGALDSRIDDKLSR